MPAYFTILFFKETYYEDSVFSFHLFIFLLLTSVGIVFFIQGIIILSSFPSDKEKFLADLKNYNEDDYNIVVSHQIFEKPKYFFKLVRKMWNDHEIKEKHKTLHLYLKRYKRPLYELLIFAVLLILSTVIIQVFGERVA